MSETPPNTPPNTLVEVRDVHKSFLHEGREVEILKGIDLTIREGEMLAVVGASGAGKSTLLHILGTLDLPTSGQILYSGQDVTQYSAGALADFRNHRLGFVFQFHHLLPEFNALENVMMPGMIRGGSSGSMMEGRARALLDEVGLSHRLSHRPGELSGGEQQRVALARALIMDPKLILADEPTGNLDSKTSDAIHSLFFKLNKTKGTTFLLVTHSRELADSMPRKVTMQDGRIELDDLKEVREAREKRAVEDAAQEEPSHNEVGSSARLPDIELGSNGSEALEKTAPEAEDADEEDPDVGSGSEEVRKAAGGDA